ncbi:Somatic embryogenesis receptor kinase 2 [Dichanthelium oligosanthes]|uniref:Somatic embryogenesis receptor kinase 2 n=1 Tax=Dichanthelium oligosanthes TaxID=888268 RepID=A0A1E5V7J7_9POAL|nr:Somatic embryogenesis receptor kinase 2 [Dichanthelium oligosanthes]
MAAPIATRTLFMAVCAAILMAVVVVSLAPVAANEEGDALMALRNAVEDPDGVLASWDPSLVNPCTWFHVGCTADNRVNRIDLANMRLSGPLPAELGKLKQLQYMQLNTNNLQGPIPSEYGNLKNLVSMDLYSNDISGHLPRTLGNLKSLKFLRIDHNRLTGPIPRELAGLANLEDVDFSSNDLCGTIPTSGPFVNVPLSSFSNNPRLKQGPGAYDANC